MKQTRCPYTTLLLSTLKEVNEEHVLPLALGAPQNFTIPASAEENSSMNDLIDEPVINDPLIRFLAMSQGVVSRSGLVSAKMEGAVQTSGESVRASINKNGVEFRFSNPIDLDESTGFVKGVRGFGEAANKHAEQVKRNYEKKGVSVEPGEAQVADQPWLEFGIVGDLNLVRQELTKIAYLMTVKLFGDEAILSKSGELYRAAILATNVDELLKTGIKGGALGSMPNLLPPQMPNVFPLPKNNEHAITCFILGGKVISAVTLFGIFNAFFVTPAVGFTVPEGTGEVVKIDVSTSNLSRRTFLDTLMDIQGQFR